jgi:catalase (peroxidase I)
MKRLVAMALLAAAASTLHGCGGGGTSTTAAPGTTTTTTPLHVPHDITVCAGLNLGTPSDNMAHSTPTAAAYDVALKALDIEAVKTDLKKLFTESSNCWPADVLGDHPGDPGNYGPFFIRLAWHCSGSYRKSDGKGGCAGGRQRFEPETSWADNTNLDKARALLAGIKQKYGDGLSWGDLFTLAGTTAARQGGAPIKQWCAGRMDNANGDLSLALGPSPEQEKNFPCAIPGQCKKPLGTTTIGLIYLNPEGPVAKNATTGEWSPNPDPALSAKDVRDTFERMDHDDRDTVALIGGGHAFGKTHGACPAGAGPSPLEVYGKTPKMEDDIPWPGLCNTGVGPDTFTSGFEFPWTTKPVEWDNEFFKLLETEEWEKFMGPGGHYQWRIKNPKDGQKHLGRLTSDMALMSDVKYKALVHEFASDLTALGEAFDVAWTKLITKGGGTSADPWAGWSKERKCDVGPFPTHLQTKEMYMQSGMIQTDMVV